MATPSKKGLHPKGELLLAQARSIYEQPFKTSPQGNLILLFPSLYDDISIAAQQKQQPQQPQQPQQQTQQRTESPIQHERKIMHGGETDKYEDENRPSTYYSVANSGARHCPLTYSSRTLIGNWQENRYLEDLPRNKVFLAYFLKKTSHPDFFRLSLARNTLLIARLLMTIERVSRLITSLPVCNT